MEDILYILMADHGILKLNSLGLKHILHSPFEKSIIERAMEYVKDRTEAFDDYYPCRKKAVDCNLSSSCLQMVCAFRIFVQFIKITI